MDFVNNKNIVPDVSQMPNMFDLPTPEPEINAGSIHSVLNETPKVDLDSMPDFYRPYLDAVRHENTGVSNTDDLSKVLKEISSTSAMRGDDIRNANSKLMNDDLDKISSGVVDVVNDSGVSLYESHIRLSDGSFKPRFEKGYIKGVDNEDYYARRQSEWEKHYNAYTKMIAKTGVNVVGGLGSIFSDVYNTIRNGAIDFEATNAFTDMLSDWNAKLDNSLPNYIRREARDYNIVESAFKDTGNFMNMLGEGVSFTAGAIITALLTKKLTGGLGSLGSRAGQASTLSRDAAGAAKTAWGQAMRNAAKSAIKGGNIGRAVDSGISLWNSSAYEAKMEQSMMMVEAEKEFFDRYFKENGRAPSQNEYSAFRKELAERGRDVFLANMAIVGSSNAIMFGKFLGLGKPLGRIARSADDVAGSINKGLFGFGVEVKDGVATALKPNGWQKGLAMGKYLTKGAITEGLWEEGVQGVASSAAKSYLDAKFSPNAVEGIPTLIGSIGEGVKHTYGAKEGWSEIGLGMLIGSMFGFLGNMRPGKRYASFERLADSYNKLNPLTSGLTYSSVNMFDRVVASSRLLSASDGELSVLSPEAKRAMRSKMLIERRMGVLDELSENFRNVINNTSDEDFAKMAEIQNNPDVISAYKSKIIQEYDQLLDDFNTAEDYAESITSGTSHEGTMFSDYIAETMFLGLQSGRDAVSYADKIGQFIRDKNISLSLQEWSDLSNEQITRIQLYKGLLDELRELDTKITNHNAASDAESARLDYERKRQDLLSKIENTKAMLESKQGFIDSNIPFLSGRSVFGGGRSDLRTGNVSADRLSAIYDDVARLEGMIENMRDDNPNKKVLSALVYGFKTSVQNNINILNAMNSISDPRFMSNQYGVFTKLLKGIAGFEEYKLEKIKGVDGESGGIKAVVKGKFFGRKEIAYNIEKEIDDALTSGKISEDEAYTYKAYMNMLSTPIDADLSNVEYVSEDEYTDFLSSGVSSELLRRVYSRAVVRGYDNITQREKDILDVYKTYKEDAERIRSANLGQLTNDNSEVIEPTEINERDSELLIEELKRNILSEYQEDDLEEKKKGLSHAVDAVLNAESLEGRYETVDDLLSMISSLPNNVDEYAQKLISAVLRRSDLLQPDILTSDNASLIANLSHAGANATSKEGTLPMVSPIRVLVRKKEVNGVYRFFVSHLNPSVFISRANNIMKSANLPYRFVFKENLDSYVLVDKETSEMIYPSEESGDTIYTIKAEPQYGQFSFNESTKRFLDEKLNIVFGHIDTGEGGDIAMDGVDYSIMYRRVVREDGVRYIPMQPNDIYGYLPSDGEVVPEEEDRRVKISTSALNELSAMVLSDPDSAPRMTLIVDPYDEYSLDFIKEFIDMHNKLFASGDNAFVIEYEKAKARLISQLVIQMRIGVDESSRLNATNGDLVGVWRAVGRKKSGYNIRLLAFNQLIDSLVKDENGLFVLNKDGLPLTKENGIESVFTVKGESGSPIHVRAESSFPGRISFKHGVDGNENTIDFHSPTRAEIRQMMGVGFVVRNGGQYTFQVNPTTDGSMDGINDSEIDMTYMSLYDEGSRIPVIVVPHKTVVNGQNVVRYYALPVNLSNKYIDEDFANLVVSTLGISGNTRDDFMNYIKSLNGPEFLESMDKLQHLLVSTKRTGVLDGSGDPIGNIMKVYDNALYGMDGVDRKPNTAIMLQNISMPYNLAFGLKISDPQISVGSEDGVKVPTKTPIVEEEESLPWENKSPDSFLGESLSKEILDTANRVVKFNKDGFVIPKTVVEFAKQIGISLKEDFVFDTREEFIKALEDAGINSDALKFIKNKRNVVRGMQYKGEVYINASALSSIESIISVLVHEFAHDAISKGLGAVGGTDVQKSDISKVKQDFPATFAALSISELLQSDKALLDMSQLYIYQSSMGSTYYMTLYDEMQGNKQYAASVKDFNLANELIAHVVSEFALGKDVLGIVDELNKYVASANAAYKKATKSKEKKFEKLSKGEIEYFKNIVTEIYGYYENGAFKNSSGGRNVDERGSSEGRLGEGDGTKTQGGDDTSRGPEQGAGELDGKHMGADEITPPERKLSLSERLEGKVAEKPMSIGDRIKFEIERYKDGLKKKIVYDKRNFTSYLKGFNYDNIENLIRVASDLLHGDSLGGEDVRIRTILAHEILSRAKDVSTTLSSFENLIEAIGPVMEGRKIASKGIQIDSSSEFIRERLKHLNLFGHDSHMSVVGDLILDERIVPSVKMSAKISQELKEGVLSERNNVTEFHSILNNYDFSEENDLIKRPCKI